MDPKGGSGRWAGLEMRVSTHTPLHIKQVTGENRLRGSENATQGPVGPKQAGNPKRGTRRHRADSHCCTQKATRREAPTLQGNKKPNTAATVPAMPPAGTRFLKHRAR